MSLSEDFTEIVDLRLDLHREILNLPTMQRIAVQKWMRDERLTHPEEEALSQAKKNLRKRLK